MRSIRNLAPAPIVPQRLWAVQPAAKSAELPMKRAIFAALVLTIVIAALEGPLRFVLHLLHLDPLIFIRDAAVFGSLFMMILLTLGTGSTPLAVGVFGFLAAVHGAIAYFNLHSVIAAVYGLKMFVPALCAFLVADLFFKPSPNLFKWIAALWILSVIGALLDKVTPGNLPWVGVQASLGGIDVSLGRDWQSGSLKRVGGFARSSISLAVILPLLSFLLIRGVRGKLLPGAIALITLVMLYWTTQKGAILAYAIAVGALACSSRKTVAPLKLMSIVMLIVMIAAPVVLVHFDMPHSKGVFSFESFIERIEDMWPRAWTWIDRYSYLMGVGLGGIGGGQRFFSPSNFNAADNFFIYLYANFGLVSVAYIIGAVLAMAGARVKNFRDDGVVLASFLFLVGYGAVVSLVEDGTASIWLGATLGWLARLNPPFLGSRWGASARIPQPTLPNR